MSYTNQLNGPIPPELGQLVNLRGLLLYSNELTGPIPPELGNLAALRFLLLSRNQLTGSVPAELGQLSNLQTLSLSQNPLSGTLPRALANLAELSSFLFDETDLCTPDDPVFQSWLGNLAIVQSTGCTVPVSVEATDLPAVFALEANYPNPFNPRTTIRYTLPQPASVEIAVYDVQGRRVALLVAAEQAAGHHEVAFEAGTLPSGVYFYRLQTDAFQQTRPMLLVK